jgi:hypothetical protein
MNLEEKANTYSEAVEFLRDKTPDDIKEYLSELNKKYEQTIDAQTALEERLKLVKQIRASCVSCFLNIHRVKKLGDLPLVFIEEEHNEYQKVVIVKVLSESERKIDHQSFNLTQWNKQ